MNKETLQNNNNRLAKNNLDLASVLSTINNLPEAGSGEPNLQDKSIEITENGTTNVTADEGYDGLNNVEVITNVEGSGGGKYAPRRIVFKEYTGTELNDEIANLDTSNVTNMKEMFYGCSNLVNLDLNNFNTSKVTSMYQMFYNCNNLTNIDVSSFDMSNVTTIYGMFWGCKAFTNIDLSNFNISKATSAQGAFRGCLALVEAILHDINFSKCTAFGDMFNGCTSLKRVDIDGWVLHSTASVSMSNIFSGCTALENISISGWVTNRVTTMISAFYNCSNLKTVKFDNVSFYYLNNMQSMFENCTSLVEVDMSGCTYLGKASVTLQNCFHNCTSLNKIDMRTFELTNAVNYYQAFAGVPADCLIIVKDDACKAKVLTMRSDLTNVKTVAELG